MSAKMHTLARRGGAATKAKAEPGYYATIGAAGGRASKGKPKTRRLAKSGNNITEVVKPSLVAIVDELEGRS